MCWIMNVKGVTLVYKHSTGFVVEYANNSKSEKKKVEKWCEEDEYEYSE